MKRSLTASLSASTQLGDKRGNGGDYVSKMTREMAFSVKVLCLMN